MLRFFILFFSFVLLAQNAKFEVIGTLEHPDFFECSGIDVYLENYFVGLNDSGNKPQIFVFDSQGKDQGVFNIEGVKNRDWEDLVVDGNTLYIGETGDNGRVHPQIFIYQVTLPNTPPGAGNYQNLKIDKAISATYPDEAHDCEGIFLRQGSLHLLTKNRGDLHQCFVLKEKEGKFVLEKCGDLQLPANYQITAADYEKETLVIATYWGWMLFAEPLFDTPPIGVLHTKTKQLEAVCFWKDQIFWTGEYREVFLHSAVKGTHFYLPPRDKVSIPFSPSLDHLQVADLIPKIAKISQTPQGLYLDLKIRKKGKRLEQVLFGWDPKANYSVFKEEQQIYVIAGTNEKNLKVLQIKGKIPFPVKLEWQKATVNKKGVRFQFVLPLKGEKNQKVGSFLCFEKQNEKYFGASMFNFPWDRPYQWGELSFVGEKQIKKTVMTPIEKDSLKQTVNTEKLKNHVKFLSELTPARNYKNLASLNKAADYIKKEWEQLGLKVTEQKYLVRGKEYKNLITFYGPVDAPRFVLGAHYDVCRDQPGADDNATGTAALIELARLLVLNKPDLKFRVELVAYTLEEPPFFRTSQMGSAIHAKSIIEQGVAVKGMVSIEMIGFYTEAPNSQEYPLKPMKLLYPSVGNFIAVVGNGASQELTLHFKTKIKEVVSLIGVQSLVAPSNVTGVDFSDHLNYWKYNIKAVMITDTSFYRNKNYHQPTDTIDTLHFGKMAEVVQGIYHTLLSLE